MLPNVHSNLHGSFVIAKYGIMSISYFDTDFQYHFSCLWTKKARHKFHILLYTHSKICSENKESKIQANKYERKRGNVYFKDSYFQKTAYENFENI